MLFFMHISAALFSGCVLGLVVRRLLAMAGMLAGFGPELMLVGMIAAAWCALQQAWMAAVWAVKPTRGRLPWVFDILSSLSALVVLPWLAGWTLPLPWPSARKYEILIFLAVFGGLHGWFKLLTFYSALYVCPGGISRVFAHLSAMGLCALASMYCWRELTEGGWEIGMEAAPEYTQRAVGDLYARSVVLREGFAYRLPLVDPVEPGMLAALWLGAADPASESTVQVTLHFLDERDRPVGALVTRELQVDGQRWRTFSVPVTQATGRAAAVRFSWSSRMLPDWIRTAGLRPVGGGTGQMYVAGPHAVAAPGGRAADALVVVALDGWGADDLEVYSGWSEAMPRLSARAAQGQVWDALYTTAPEPAGAWVSLLTGRTPLTHGYLAGREGDSTLPTWGEWMREKGYVTALYSAVRGLGADPLENIPLIEKGMLFVNRQCPAELMPEAGRESPPRIVPGSIAQTLEDAVAWLEENRDKPVFLMIRLRESDHPVWLPRHRRDLFPRGRKPDAAQLRAGVMLDIDDKLDGFFSRVSEIRGERAVYCVLAPFSADARRDAFSSPDRCLRIPGFCWTAGLTPGRVPQLGTLCDVWPTLAALAGLDVPQDVEGGVLYRMGEGRVSVSAWGNPLQLSLRSSRFRLTLNTGVPLFSAKAADSLQVTAFEQIQDGGRVKQEITRKSPYQTVLDSLLDTARELLRSSSKKQASLEQQPG